MSLTLSLEVLWLKDEIKGVEEEEGGKRAGGLTALKESRRRAPSEETLALIMGWMIYSSVSLT